MIDALVIKTPFLIYGRGQIVTDPQNIEDLLASEYRRHVVKTQVVDPEA